jgi:hypothetical protein
MSDQELTNRLRQIGQRVAVPCPDGIKGCAVFHYRVETEPTCAEAADRIERLLESVKGLSQAWATAAVNREVSEGKLEKAVMTIKLALAGWQSELLQYEMTEDLDDMAAVKAVLAELEKPE